MSDIPSSSSAQNENQSPSIQVEKLQPNLTKPAKSAKDNKSKTKVSKKPIDGPPTASGKPRVRKFHSKSRNGCASCKHLRIKCDELKPTCTQCSVRSKICKYLGNQKNQASLTDKNMDSKGFIELEIPNLPSTATTTTTTSTTTKPGPILNLSVPLTVPPVGTAASSYDIKLSAPIDSAAPIQKAPQVIPVHVDLHHHYHIHHNVTSAPPPSYAPTSAIPQPQPPISNPISNPNPAPVTPSSTYKPVHPVTDQSIRPTIYPAPPGNQPLTSLDHFDPIKQIKHGKIFVPSPEEQMLPTGATLPTPSGYKQYVPTSASAATGPIAYSQPEAISYQSMNNINSIPRNANATASYIPGSYGPPVPPDMLTTNPPPQASGIPGSFVYDSFQQYGNYDFASEIINAFTNPDQTVEEQFYYQGSNAPPYNEDENGATNDNNTEREKRNIQENQYPLYKSPRNAPNLFQQEGLPYDYIINFFQVYISSLLSQTQNDLYQWKYVVPQLAFENMLISNSIIAYTALVMKDRMVMGHSIGPTFLKKLKDNVGYRDDIASSGVVEETGEEGSQDSQDAHKDEKIVLENAEKIIGQMAKRDSYGWSSTIDKLTELSLKCHGRSLRLMARATANAKQNTEAFFAVGLITGYSLTEAVLLVSDTSRRKESLQYFKNKKHSKKRYTPPSVMHEFEVPEEEQELDPEDATKGIDDDIDQDALPDIFEMLKGGDRLVIAVYPYLDHYRTILENYPLTPILYFSMEDFQILRPLDRKILRIFVPVLKQIVHMKRGNRGLCPHLTGERGLYDKDDRDLEEIKREKIQDYKDLEEIIKRSLPAAKVVGTVDSFIKFPAHNIYLTDPPITASTGVYTPFTTNENGEYLQYETYGEASEIPFNEPSVSDYNNVDPSDPFYLYPGELESCALMVYVFMQIMYYSEYHDKIKLLWSIFRDAPPSFLFFARKNRPLPLIILLWLCTVFESSQWFLGFVFLKQTGQLTKRIPKEWYPAATIPIEFLTKVVNQETHLDPWMRYLAEYRKERASKRRVV